VPPLDSTVAIATPPSAADVSGAALGSRPALRAGNAEVQRAQAEFSVMRSMYGPMAMVRTGPAYTMTDGAGWMVMVGIGVPIWRERRRAGVTEAEAMVDMARADVASMRRMVEGEALSTREQVIAARERYLSLRDEVIPRARQAIEPSLAGYSAGQLPLVSVLEAAQALWSAQADLLSAQYDLGLAWARLERATGSAPRGARR
jgi:outer membrane protein TolC